MAGLKLILLDRYEAGKASAVYVSKDPAIVPAGPAHDHPPGLSGTVEIIRLDDPSNRAVCALPADWLVNAASVQKCVNRTAAPGGPGAKVVLIKAGRVARVVAKNLGDGDGASGDDLALALSLPAGAPAEQDVVAEGTQTNLVVLPIERSSPTRTPSRTCTSPARCS